MDHEVRHTHPSLYVCPSHSVKTVCQIDFKLGRCVAEDPRICVCAFGEASKHKLFFINKIPRHVMLICLFFGVESVSENNSVFVAHMMVEGGIGGILSIVMGLYNPAMTERRREEERGHLSLPHHDVQSFALLK